MRKIEVENIANKVATSLLQNECKGMTYNTLISFIKALGDALRTKRLMLAMKEIKEDRLDKGKEVGISVDVYDEFSPENVL